MRILSRILSLRCLLYTALLIVCSAAGHAQMLDISCPAIPAPETQLLRQLRLHDLRKNTVGNVELYVTNYGVLGLNVDANAGGMSWPRGSRNQYGFGGGMWFGAVKYSEAMKKFNKLVTLSYNPNSGLSWFVPGRIADGDTAGIYYPDLKKYPVFLSADHNADGTVNDGSGVTNWPIWHTQPGGTPGVYGYTGEYVADPAQRTLAVYPGGPVVLSDEDIVSIYKDTDLRYYETGVEEGRRLGYPLRMEVVETIYTWATGDLKDAFIVRYELTNMSADTLRDCWFAPAIDFDMGQRPNTQMSADNDRVRYYNEDPSLNMALQWTDGNRGEAGKGFGYVGVVFVYTPAVDGNGVLRTDETLYPREEQLGLKTFRNWVIDNDPTTDSARYDFISSMNLDGDTGPGDKRFLMATGPFTMLPGERMKTALAFVFARGSKGGEADGTTEDLVGLAELARRARQKYEESMHAGVVDVQERVAAESMVSIGRVYPNPASAVSRLEFSLGAPADVAIDITDITGRTAYTHRAKLPGGPHVVEINAATLPQGVYTCRVSAHGHVQSVLFLVVR